MFSWVNKQLLIVLISVAIPFFARFFLKANINSTSSSTLYCVRPGSSYFVVTLNSSLSRAACFRVQNGIFTEALAAAPASDLDREVSYMDGYVVPGIIDSHGHLLQYGEMLESVSLFGVHSIEGVKAKINEFLRLHKGESYGSSRKWIRGVGWDQAHLGGVMPTAEELADNDSLRGLFIMLDRVDTHCIWVSPSVLSLLPDPLPDAPSGGVIVTDPGPGVFCDNAVDDFIIPLYPGPDYKQKSRWISTAMAELNKVGLVGVGDAGMRPNDIRILESLAERGKLTLRVDVMLECAKRNDYCPEEIQGLAILGPSKSIGDDMVMLGGVKLFADGALGSWGAAMLEPYSDKPGTAGTMLINETELTYLVKKWFDAGFQVNIHAIGDRANRASVDAFEKVLGERCEECNKERRLRIEHAQIIHPDDQKRIERMGIIASIQPTHATSDMSYALSRLGPDRLARSAYRMSSLFPSRSGPDEYPGPVLGSDFPVEPANPFHGMYAATTRLNPLTGTSPAGPGGWYPEERLTVEQALLGFTRNAAYGWGKEAAAGAIEAGKWADWVVVDGDIFESERGADLRDIAVKETWIGGRRVYPNNDANAAALKRLMECLAPVYQKFLDCF